MSVNVVQKGNFNKPQNKQADTKYTEQKTNKTAA